MRRNKLVAHRSEGNEILAPGHDSVLDAGHDDYWGQGDSVCGTEPWPDVSLSPYLDSP
jgi:hypothetical protein